MKEIKKILSIEKGDVVSIVGSGGKSTMLFKLANELRNEYRVLASTSTKIMMPSAGDCDYLYCNIENYFMNKPNANNSITVVSKKLDFQTNKLIGIDDDDLECIVKDFDIVLLESDGSRNLPIKGWKDHEPPVLKRTNKTIGIFPADYINKRAEKDFIYGIDEFNILTEKSEYIDFESIRKICSNKNGIFKNSKGSLYLFFNKAETREEINVVKELSEYLKKSAVNKPYNFKIILGSLEKGVYYEC